MPAATVSRDRPKVERLPGDSGLPVVGAIEFANGEFLEPSAVSRGKPQVLQPPAIGYKTNNISPDILHDVANIITRAILRVMLTCRDTYIRV